jgi:hypothetical protein
MRIIVFILLFSLAQSLQAGIKFVDVDDLNTWEKMFILAQKQGLDILVYIDYLPCDNCKKLRKETFKNKELAQFIAQNTLALRINAASEAGEALEKAYDYTDVPTLLYLNVREELFYTQTGFITASALLKDLKRAQTFAANYTTWLNRAKANDLDLEEWLNLTEIGAMNKRVNPGSEIVEQVSLMLDSGDFANTRVLRFVENLCVDVDGAVFQTLVEHPGWITDTTNFNWDIYQKNVYNYSVNRAIVQKDSVLLEDVLHQVSRLSKAKGIPKLKFKGRQLYLAERNKWNQYDSLTTAYLDSLPTDSVDLYEVEAAQLMSFYTENDRAMTIALRYLRMGLKKKETYQLYYGLCLWLYYQYDYVNAYKAGYRAYELAETDEERALAKKLLIAIDDEY